MVQCTYEHGGRAIFRDCVCLVNVMAAAASGGGPQRGGDRQCCQIAKVAQNFSLVHLGMIKEVISGNTAYMRRGAREGRGVAERSKGSLILRWFLVCALALYLGRSAFGACGGPMRLADNGGQQSMFLTKPPRRLARGVNIISSFQPRL